MVFNATFNNISVISWRSALQAEETGVSGENHHNSQTNFLYYSSIVAILSLRVHRTLQYDMYN